MAVADFVEKFKIVERALARAEKRVLQKRIASAIFSAPQVAPSSAEVMWSDCKRGRRDFPESKLDILFAVLNEETNGLLNQIAPSIFLVPVRKFEDAFISAGLIDRADSQPMPLSEVLINIKSAEEVRRLLGYYSATRESSDEFEIAFHLLPDDKKLVVASWFREVVEASFLSGKNTRTGFVAACALMRIWPLLAQVPEIGQLTNRLETIIDDLSPNMVLLAGPVSKTGSLLGSHGSFRSHVKRLVEDQNWRRIDYATRLRYYHGLRKAADNIAGHLMYRRGHGQVACEDVGTLITIYPRLARERELSDLLAFLKEGTIKALKYADVDRTTCRRVEAMLEGSV